MPFPLPLLATKPSFGAPCNGCGLCCLSEQCRVSIKEFGAQDVCPALETEQGRYWCGLMIHPSKYGAGGELAQHVGEECAAGFWRSYIGAGKGCDSEDGGVK
jgi:hypothetical protein